MYTTPATARYSNRMSARAILLRVLLCVALVVNGATPAMASAQMVQMHAAHLSDSRAVSRAAQVGNVEPSASCHDQVAQAQPQHAGEASDHQQPDQSVPGCCKSSACPCACVHHAAAMMPLVAFHGASIAQGNSVRPMALSHPAPALPHLIRPPIG